MRCSLVSNKIIQARERLGLTQQQLAEKLCVTNKAVSKWECGVTLPDISLLVPLCRVLGLTVQELLDEYDGKFGNTPGCQTTEDPAQDTLFAAQQHSHYLYIDLENHLYGVAPFVWPQPGAYQSQHHGWSQRPDDPQPEVCRRCGAQRRSAGLGRHRRMRVLCQ